MRLIPVLMAGGLLLSGLGCSSRSEPKPDGTSSQISVHDCMSELDLNQLETALKRCNKVVNAHSDQLAALTDRSLLLTLMGKTDQACADVFKALELLSQSSVSTDPMVVHELNVRQKSCKQRETIIGRG